MKVDTIAAAAAAAEASRKDESRPRRKLREVTARKGETHSPEVNYKHHVMVVVVMVRDTHQPRHWARLEDDHIPLTGKADETGPAYQLGPLSIDLTHTHTHTSP